MSDIRYPIGKFSYQHVPEQTERIGFISNIQSLPGDLRAVVRDMDDKQLDTAYRAGGWTIRQVIHHLADSHMNAYMRFKLTLTENEPTIKPYIQDAWADTAENFKVEPQISIDFLDALHQKWVALLQTMTASDFEKVFNHPESGKNSLNKALALYAWHGRHHLAQIQALKKERNW
jgi:uncharacterized damage-inducible protein DinB